MADIRTFIAIELSKEVKKELAEIQEKLKKLKGDISWVKPDNIHLTLKFLSDIPEDKVHEISRILDSLKTDFKPYALTLTSVGAFPRLDYARVLWVGTRDSGETEKIFKELEEELSMENFHREDRPFTAHLTLARVKSLQSKSELKKLAETLKVKPIAMTVTSVTLFKSQLSPKGAIYTSLHTVKF